MSQQRVGIKNVAQAAGVSVTTVSHVLNGKGRVNEKTREHVKEVAARLGYRPHPVAQQLAGGRNRTIAFMVRASGTTFHPPTDYEYFNELMDACAASALTRGYRMMLMPSALELEEIEGMSLAGVVLVDPILDDPLLAMLRDRGIPTVTTGRDPAGSRESGIWVDNDHGLGTRKVLDHFAEQGAETIAFVNSTNAHSYSIDALEAYEQWCSEHGIEPLIASVGPVLDESAGYEALLELLDRGRSPDAVHTVLDRLALGVLLAARARELSVPEDLLVSGTTDTAASRAARPALTVLSLEPAEIGRIAAEMLMDVIEGVEPAEKHRTIESYLIPRASSLRAHPEADASENGAGPAARRRQLRS